MSTAAVILLVLAAMVIGAVAWWRSVLASREAKQQRALEIAARLERGRALKKPSLHVVDKSPSGTRSDFGQRGDYEWPGSRR